MQTCASKMEDVYVIKVKTKPALATLYPSERRYSASTVGGLALVHLTFGTLGLLLGIIGNSVQGIVLFVSCLAPLSSGILAWKRWYIDRNITIFFYCCVFSTAVAASCFIAAVYDLSVLTEKVVTLEKNNQEHFDLYNQTLDPDPRYLTPEATPEVTSFSTNLYLDSENGTNLEDNDLEVVNIVEDVKYVKSRIFLMINVAVACLLEFVWSLLSIKIALRGMKKEFSEDSQREDGTGDKKVKVTSPTLSSRPDIILMNKHICCSMQSLDSLQSLNVQNVQNMYPKLPLPESNKEFKERVDKFLSNQVHHRNVSEGT